MKLGTLDDEQKRRRAKNETGETKEPFSFLEASKMIIQVLRILGALHIGTEGRNDARIHGDIKPSNIFLDKPNTEADKPFLMMLGDFNLSRQRKSELDSSKATVPGTRLYMHPEAYTGAISSNSPKIDLYATAVVYYEMLTNYHPFDGQECLARTNPKPPSDFGIKLSDVFVDKVLNRALNTEREGFDTAEAFIRAIETHLASDKNQRKLSPIAEVMRIQINREISSFRELLEEINRAIPGGKEPIYMKELVAKLQTSYQGLEDLAKQIMLEDEKFNSADVAELRDKLDQIKRKDKLIADLENEDSRNLIMHYDKASKERQEQLRNLLSGLGEMTAIDENSHELRQTIGSLQEQLLRVQANILAAKPSQRNTEAETQIKILWQRLQEAIGKEGSP